MKSAVIQQLMHSFPPAEARERDEPAVLMPKPPSVPPRPTKLSAWMGKHGRPNRLTVDYVPTGADTAETIITLEVVDTDNKAHAKIEVKPGDLIADSYGSRPGEDVHLALDHAHVCDWTTCGKKRLEEWLAWEKREARDLADYKRLREKFGDL